MNKHLPIFTEVLGYNKLIKDLEFLEQDTKATLEENDDMRGFESDEDDEIDTLGGLVSQLCGHVPVRGEVIIHPSGVEFEVLDADLRRIKRLRVSLPNDNV